MAWMAILRYMFTTANCHWLIISIICCLFSAVCLLDVVWRAEKCGKRNIANSVRREAAYLESAENVRIFRGRYIVWTLTNNANIII